ncbi:MAG: hypothetical protein DSY89_05400 [Deltaproteobacteria bacterium]|nr:MAG: hypothetical protein DSY89_05400 [Deltaproteobacteria bacterium]
MQTPGKELSHATGFCLGEGLAGDLADIGPRRFYDDIDINVVTVTFMNRLKRPDGHSPPLFFPYHGRRRWPVG